VRAVQDHGTPVTILAAWRANPPAHDWGDDDALRTPVVVLTEQAAVGFPSGRLAGMLAADVATLRPRHAARALRLAALALAGSSLVPGDTTVLHAHFANDAAVLARYLGCLLGIPYRLTAHAYDLHQDPFLLDRNLRFASRILTVSEANRTFLEQRLLAKRLGNKLVEVVRCGIDLERFAYRDPVAPGRPARLLCVARLVPKKGHAVLLEALARLRQAGTDATLDLAGDGPLAGELALRAQRPDLSGQVRWLGTVAHDEIRRAMLDADAVVLASRVAEDGDRDGIPVALMEAMALGVPVVATSVAGIPELVTPGAGTLAEPDDAVKLADAIGVTLGSPLPHLVAQTRAARARVEAEFDLRKIADRLDEG